MGQPDGLNFCSLEPTPVPRKCTLVAIYCIGLLFLSLPDPSYAEPSAETETPVIALVKAGGWVMYTGPDFVLYESGLVVFKRRSGLFPPEYFAVTLGRGEVEKLLASLAIEEFMGLKARYDLTKATDQVTNWVVLWKPSRKVTQVYGYIPTPQRHVDRKTYTEAPDEFVKAYKALDGFDHPEAKPWFPETIRVSAYPMPKQHWISTPLSWPTHWPALEDATIERSSYGSYHFYVTLKDLEVLKEMFPKVGEEHFLTYREQQYKVQYNFRVPSEGKIREIIYPR